MCGMLLLHGGLQIKTGCQFTETEERTLFILTSSFIIVMVSCKVSNTNCIAYKRRTINLISEIYYYVKELSIAPKVINNNSLSLCLKVKI